MMKKNVVIKLGGSMLGDAGTLKELASLVRSWQQRDYSVIVVHGGGPAINAELRARGITWQFIQGQRQTTPEMMTVIEEVLSGPVNTRTVQELCDQGLSALGLSGARDQILFCTQASEQLGLVGSVERVGTKALSALAPTTVAVIAPIGFGVKGERYNINADWAAAKIAVAVKAEKLIFLTDQSGILDGEKRLVRRATPEEIHQMIDQGVISGGMHAKVLAMMAALDSGIRQIQVLNALNSSRIFMRAGVGTILVPAKPETSKSLKKGNFNHVRAS